MRTVEGLQTRYAAPLHFPRILLYLFKSSGLLTRKLKSALL